MEQETGQKNRNRKIKLYLFVLGLFFVIFSVQQKIALKATAERKSVEANPLNASKQAEISTAAGVNPILISKYKQFPNGESLGNASPAEIKVHELQQTITDLGQNLRVQETRARDAGAQQILRDEGASEKERRYWDRELRKISDLRWEIIEKERELIRISLEMTK